jgi:hypothetical protein
VANEITAAVVTVQYGGHDATAAIRSWWATFEEADKAAEQVQAEEDPDAESLQVFAVSFMDTPLVLAL